MPMRKVTKAEYTQFLERYPRPLDPHVVTIAEPPILTFNDFSLGKYPQSVVAQISTKWSHPNELDDATCYVWDDAEGA